MRALLLLGAFVIAVLYGCTARLMHASPAFAVGFGAGVLLVGVPALRYATRHTRQ